MTGRLAAALAIGLGLPACHAIGAPTYTSAGVTIHGCPSRRPAPGHPFFLSFSVVNRSGRVWPATYLLLSPSGAMRTGLAVSGESTEGIGGGITRVKSALAPGRRVSGTIRAYTVGSGSASVNLGAWGAPGNSVSVPPSYTNPGCSLRP
jgi:hypothetical protein